MSPAAIFDDFLKYFSWNPVSEDGIFTKNPWKKIYREIKLKFENRARWPPSIPLWEHVRAFKTIVLGSLERTVLKTKFLSKSRHLGRGFSKFFFSQPGTHIFWIFSSKSHTKGPNTWKTVKICRFLRPKKFLKKSVKFWGGLDCLF